MSDTCIGIIWSVLPFANTPLRKWMPKKKIRNLFTTKTSFKPTGEHLRYPFQQLGVDQKVLYMECPSIIKPPKGTRAGKVTHGQNWGPPKWNLDQLADGLTPTGDFLYSEIPRFIPTHVPYRTTFKGKPKGKQQIWRVPYKKTEKSNGKQPFWSPTKKRKTKRKTTMLEGSPPNKTNWKTKRTTTSLEGPLQKKNRKPN